MKQNNAVDPPDLDFISKSFYTKLSPIKCGVAELSIMPATLPGEKVRLDGTWYYFNRLFVPPEFRSKGTGHDLMQQVMQWADQNEINIYLDVNPYDGSSELPRLLSFYSKHGFTLMHHSTMVRLAATRQPRQEPSHVKRD